MNQEIALKSEVVSNRLKPISKVVLKAAAILNWEKPYHMPVLSSMVSIFFMLLWLIDVSVLSKLCILSIFFLLLDLALPILNEMIAKNKRSEEDEVKFQDICLKLATVWCNLETFYQSYCQLKYTNTKTYYSTLLTSLLIFAWIASIVHNLLLTYLIVLGLVLYPGLSKQESFKTYVTNFASKISSLASSKSGNKNSVKKDK